MPDVDPLAFDIRFALTHKSIGREARKLIRSLPDDALELLCQGVAEHLRLCRWQQLPPEPRATGDSVAEGAELEGELTCLIMISAARRMRARRFG